jgi:hypothetical protein
LEQHFVRGVLCRVEFHKVAFQDLLLGHQGERVEDLLEACVVFAMAITFVIAFRCAL